MRLAAQGLTAQRWRTAAEAVRAFGVTQGQDLHSVRRSLALRAADESDKSEIVRGYAMRNTLFASSIKDMDRITGLCAKPRAGDGAIRDTVLGLTDAPLKRVELKEHAVQVLPVVGLWQLASFSVVCLWPGVSLESVHNEATIASTFRINSYLSLKGNRACPRYVHLTRITSRI